MKYKEWLREWLECYVKPFVKPKTYVRYSEIVETHVAVAFGDCDMEEITPFALQKFVTEALMRGNLRTGKGLSENSVNGLITVVQSSLKSAYSVGLISEYTANRVRRPRAGSSKVESFTLAEQKKIESAVLCGKNESLFGIVLCLYTGLRIGELLALTWNDVDLHNGLLSVNKTCYDGRDEDGKYTRVVVSPKTKTSERIIPFPKQLICYLNKLKIAVNSVNVISSASGKVIYVRSYQRSFETLLRRLGIAHKGFHALRHTFATRALESGMDVKTLSEILGHKNAAVTLNRYVHSFMEHRREMMNRLGKLL